MEFSILSILCFVTVKSDEICILGKYFDPFSLARAKHHENLVGQKSLNYFLTPLIEMSIVDVSHE